jgi:hypothetical protein
MELSMGVKNDIQSLQKNIKFFNYLLQDKNDSFNQITESFQRNEMTEESKIKIKPQTFSYPKIICFIKKYCYICRPEY